MKKITRTWPLLQIQFVEPVFGPEEDCYPKGIRLTKKTKPGRLLHSQDPREVPQFLTRSGFLLSKQSRNTRRA